jgi:hypothetical protein
MIKSRRMKWQGMWHKLEREDLHSHFYKKTKGELSFGRHRRRWDLVAWVDVD